MMLQVDLGGMCLVLGTCVAGAVVMATAMLWHVTPVKCRRLHLWMGWVMNHLELCHRLYIRSRRPHRIILMRHAESEGNVDKGVYTSTPDHALKITERGKRQAAVAGRELKKVIGDESVYFIVSPYTRTRMTYEIIRKELGEIRQFAMKEDPRLRELDFGNFQDLAAMSKTMETRNAYGRFWFRFMNGESGADVYDRATAFWESVFRSMDHTTGCRFNNYVIVTHGLMMRLILMRYFQWKVEFFERVWNPDNCETWVMERDERGSYRVVTEILDKPAWATESTSTAPEFSSSEETSAGSSAAEFNGEGEAAVAPGAISGRAAIAAADRAARDGSRDKSFAAQQLVPIGAGSAAAATAGEVSLADAGGIERTVLLSRKPTVDMPESADDGHGYVEGGERGGAVGEEAEEGGELELKVAAAALGRGNERSRRAKSGEVLRGSRGRPVPLSTAGSALNLQDGGFAPGEDGCGRDEEL